MKPSSRIALDREVRQSLELWATLRANVIPTEVTQDLVEVGGDIMVLICDCQIGSNPPPAIEFIICLFCSYLNNANNTNSVIFKNISDLFCVLFIFCFIFLL